LDFQPVYRYFFSFFFLFIFLDITFFFFDLNFIFVYVGFAFLQPLLYFSIDWLLFFIFFSNEFLQ